MGTTTEIVPKVNAQPTSTVTETTVIPSSMPDIDGSMEIINTTETATPIIESPTITTEPPKTESTTTEIVPTVNAQPTSTVTETTVIPSSMPDIDGSMEIIT